MDYDSIESMDVKLVQVPPLPPRGPRECEAPPCLQHTPLSLLPVCGVRGLQTGDSDMTRI